MDFVTGLSVSANWKDNNYDSIHVIIDRLTNIVYYKPVKVTINTLKLAEFILDMVVWHHGLPDSIVTDRGLLFTSKFWLLLLASNISFQPHSSLRQMVKPRGKTALWKFFFEPSSTSSKMTGLGFYQWRRLHITMPRMLAAVTCFPIWTMVTILGYHTRKMLTPAPGQSRWINY